MSFLVTGGAGFIGSNIVEKLVSDGKQVTVIDNFHTGNMENLSKVKVNLLRESVSEIGKLKFDKPDAIFHQGVYSSSPMYKENPVLTGKAVEDFVNLLEYARKNDVPIVFASSSSIYNGLCAPQKEDMIPLVKDFYSEARYAMERVAELYTKFYGMKIAGLRYFSVYGPHEKSKGKYANLVSQFLWAMLENKTPVIYGDGEQLRDFVHVSDVVNANLLAAEKRTSGIFNVGTGKSASINHLLTILNKKLGTNIEATHIQNPVKNYVDKTQADTNKSKKDLGFEAKVSLEDGIEKLIDYYRKG
ncbi:NAD-dependent epimerase/dehydratase family protein [Candidatus Micrarchaeota archaeon]|nr:NAD-dependent epimerase/dehydratase family protein [Candidatus Micrarchaeota archaeon]